MKQFIRYNNNRNRVFLIDCYNNYTKITTYRTGINNCLKLNSVKYFNKGSVINFNGDNPTLYSDNGSTRNAQRLWNTRNISNKWKELMYKGNEWNLYQKDILSN